MGDCGNVDGVGSDNMVVVVGGNVGGGYDDSGGDGINVDGGT